MRTYNKIYKLADYFERKYKMATPINLAKREYAHVQAMNLLDLIANFDPKLSKSSTLKKWINELKLEIKSLTGYGDSTIDVCDYLKEEADRVIKNPKNPNILKKVFKFIKEEAGGDDEDYSENDHNSIIKGKEHLPKSHFEYKDPNEFDQMDYNLYNDYELQNKEIEEMEEYFSKDKDD